MVSSFQIYIDVINSPGQESESLFNQAIDNENDDGGNDDSGQWQWEW